jgi:hypothetical protein
MPEYLNALRKTNKGSTLVFDNKESFGRKDAQI